MAAMVEPSTLESKWWKPATLKIPNINKIGYFEPAIGGTVVIVGGGYY